MFIPNSLLVVYMIALFLQIAIGFYCAYKMGPDQPFWVRAITLMPCLAAFASLWGMLMHIYVPYVHDLINLTATVCLYALVASKFSAKPWLEIRRKHDTI